MVRSLSAAPRTWLVPRPPPPVEQHAAFAARAQNPLALPRVPQPERAASCNGTEPFAVSILTDLLNDAPKLEQIVADRERQKGKKIRDEEDEEFRSVFMGLAVAPDNRTLYASSGNQGSVFVFDLAERKRVATIKLNDATYQNSFLGELRLTRDGRRLYVLDQANYRIAVVDPAKREVIESLPAVRAPFSIALSPDERRLYVTNVGVFRYSLIEGYDPKDPKRTGVSFPPFGYPSEDMKRGVIVEEVTRGITVEGKRVPGLGDPNHEDAASVWTYDVGADGRLKIAAKSTCSWFKQPCAEVSVRADNQSPKF